MAHKLLITLREREDAERVRASGAEVLAEYPDTLLVRADEAQQRDIDRAQLETAPLETTPTVQTATARFDFDDAVAVDAEEPVALDPDRTAYFIVQLAGPVAEGWLDALHAHGVAVHGALPGYRLLVGMLPDRRETVRAEAFVEEVVPYRPAMKLSPRLRTDVAGRRLSTANLARVDVRVLAPDESKQVQVTVFSGESVEEVAARVRSGGGTVISTALTSMVALAPPAVLARLAEEPGVEAITPHTFPDFTNDRATRLMGIPDDRVIGGTKLTGAGQLVGLADSGIDTGDAATLHPDLRGRVRILSSRNQLAALSRDQPPFDDGPSDQRAHGTHVAASVAGSGAAAMAAGSSTVPRGVAPEAELFFTAIGQRVNWDPDKAARNYKPYGLWGLPADLTDLFEPAYAAGARIHTNSWGSDDDGLYASTSRDVDRFMFSHRDMLIVFAAGNAGADLNRDGQVDADSIGSPGTAKNCLTVGASENDRPPTSTPTPGRPRPWTSNPKFPDFAAAGFMSDNPEGLALFSSRGPTDDDRIKPEVVAPGTNVLSARSSTYDAAYVADPTVEPPATRPPPLWGEVLPATDPLAGRYCWSGGTSMATPLVAGAVALIRQHLVEQRGHNRDGVTPSGALLKAFVINGARPLAGQYEGEVPAEIPNNVTGFGRVDLTSSLSPQPLGLSLFSDDPSLALVSGQTRTFQIHVPGGDTPLKATLTWTDPPSLIGAGGLQNMLYLRVVPPGEAPLDGDVEPYPTAVNNTQQVLIPAPVAGTYEIQVRAVNVTRRSASAGARPGEAVQDFALVVSGATELSTIGRLA